MGAAVQLHSHFKTPEGLFQIYSERQPRVNFSQEVCDSFKSLGH